MQSFCCNESFAVEFEHTMTWTSVRLHGVEIAKIALQYSGKWYAMVAGVWTDYSASFDSLKAAQVYMIGVAALMKAGWKD